MASIWKHPRSRYWTACFRDVSGKQRRISTKETNRSKAQKIADSFEKAARQKRTIRHTREVIERLHAEISGEAISKVTLREFAAQWLAIRKPEIKPRTIEFYGKSIEKLLSGLGELSDEPISEINKSHLLKFRAAMSEGGLASHTINNHLKVAKMLFKAARRDGVLSEDPCEFVATVRAQRAAAKLPFTVPEIRAVLSVADPEWQSLVLFGLFSGQRLTDLARLQWSNIDLALNQLRFVTSKTGKTVIIPLAAPLRKHIESLPSSDDPAAPIHPRACTIVDMQGRSATLSREFGELLADAGLRKKQPHHISLGKTLSGPREVSRLSFHSLRRTATTILHESGIPQAVVKEFIGHSSDAVHEGYISVGREALTKAAAAFPEIT